MSMIRSLPGIFGCYFIALALAAGLPWLFYICMHALWEAAVGLWLYRSPLRIFFQGGGQLIIAAILFFELVVGFFVATVAVSKGNQIARYEWYLFRGGDPLFYAKYREDKLTWRPIAFRKLA